MRCDVALGVFKWRSFWRSDQRQKLVEVIVGIYRESFASEVFQSDCFFDYYWREVDSQKLEPNLKITIGGRDNNAFSILVTLRLFMREELLALGIVEQPSLARWCSGQA